MPDRDLFNVLQASFRPAARELVRAAQGEEFEQLKVADALNRLFEGGVASLGMTLRLVASRNDERQASFQDSSFDRLYRKALFALCHRTGHHNNDKRLYRAAVHACERGAADTHELVRQFILSVINAELIEAIGGVREQLDQRGVLLDATRLEKALSPLIDTAAALMVQRPHFKRLGLASKSWREVDLYNENLLGGLV